MKKSTALCFMTLWEFKHFGRDDPIHTPLRYYSQSITIAVVAEALRQHAPTRVRATLVVHALYCRAHMMRVDDGRSGGRSLMIFRASTTRFCRSAQPRGGDLWRGLGAIQQRFALPSPHRYRRGCWRHINAVEFLCKVVRQ